MVPMRRYPQALITSAQDSCGVTITMSKSSRSLIMWKTIKDLQHVWEYPRSEVEIDVCTCTHYVYIIN